MNSKIPAILATLLVAVAPLAGAANVAAGANVTTTGAGFGLSNGWGAGTLAAPSTVVDGAFVADSTQWNLGTVYWQGDSADTADTITIRLAGAATVTSLLLQGDNNDIYSVSYEDLGGTWHALATFSPHGTVAAPDTLTVGWGMMKAGRPVTVWYDSRDPGEFVFEQDSAGWWTPALGLGFLMGAFVLL